MTRAARSGSCTRAGFTLFEVLAAVAVLGILYTVLAGIAMDGLRWEGDAERRLRASLLADRVLSELEQSFAGGVAPPLGQTEDEQDEFMIAVDVHALDIASFVASLPGAEAPTADTPPAALLMPPPQGNPPLVEIEVRVRWIEGAYEQEVRRLTYGFDLSVASAALEGVSGATAAAAPSAAPSQPGSSSEAAGFRRAPAWLAPGQQRRRRPPEPGSPRPRGPAPRRTRAPEPWRGNTRRRSRRHGFTLIEMMVVVMFTAIVLVVAVDFFLQLGSATTSATERTREGRRAAAILDRVARDLQSVVLVAKPDETDPLEHPWLFLAESGSGAAGAEQVMFVSRGRVARSSATHESDLERVSYFLAQDEDGTTSLLRWSSPRLPEGLDRDLPRAGDAGAVVLARDIAAFGVRMLSEDGAWETEWDSSTIARSSELPIAVEINVAVYPEGAAEGDDLEIAEPALWSRQVQLPVRPLDLVVLLDPEAAAAGRNGDEDEEDDEDASDDDGTTQAQAMTISECFRRLGSGLTPPPGVDPEVFLQRNLHALNPEWIRQNGLQGCLR